MGNNESSNQVIPIEALNVCAKNGLKSKFAYLFNNELLSDIQFKLKVNDQYKIIYAHKLIIGTSSTFFYKLFNTSKEIKTLDLPEGINFESCKDFVKFLYTDDIKLTSTNVFDILRMANEYEIKFLSNLCILKIKSMIRFGKKIDFMYKPDIYKISELNDVCQQLMDEQCNVLYNSNLYTMLPLDGFKIFLQSDYISVPEKCLFQCAMLWIKENGNQLSQDNSFPTIMDIINWIRFPLMSQLEYVEIADKFSFFTPKQIVNIIRSINDPKYEIKEYNRNPRNKIYKKPEILIAKIYKGLNFPDKIQQCDLCEIILKPNQNVMVAGLWVLINLCGIIDSSIQIMEITLEHIEHTRTTCLSKSSKILEENENLYGLTKMNYYFDNPILIQKDQLYIATVTFPKSNIGVCCKLKQKEDVYCGNDKVGINSSVSFEIKKYMFSSIIGILYSLNEVK